MSSTVFSEPNFSTVQTRRNPTRNDDTGNNSQRNTERRSLSGKFRSLFRKNSSPNRTISNDGRLSPAPSLPRQRSTSPETIRASTEAPHLRAPTVHWPFGKKKAKLTTTPTTTTPPTNNKTKTKNSRKIKKNSPPPMVISSPVYVDDHQSSIRGQNFVPRTPEFAHGGTGRTQSSSSYEGTTKGFRDYVIIDHPKTFQQLVVTDDDIMTPPPYVSDHSRSPSLDHQRSPYMNIDYSHHHDTSPRTQPLSATRILAQNTPILPQTSVFPSPPPPVTVNQWKNTSSSSLNNNAIHSTTSPTIDVDVPKLHTPLVSLSSKSNTIESKQTDPQSRSDQMYTSSATINTSVQPNRPYIRTYNGLPDTEIVHSDSLTPLTPIQSNIRTYPGLSAIVEHHMRPSSISYNRHPSTIITTPQQIHRYDTSTTTFDDYDQQQKSQWPTNSITGLPPSSSSSTHRSDGYIRPLTPSKLPIQPDVNVIHVHSNDFNRIPSRPTHYDSTEIPVTYRSSTTIFTKDKHSPLDGGEIRTWSNRGNNDTNANKKSSTSIFIERSRNDHQNVPTKTTNEFQYNPRIHDEEINDHNQPEEERYDVTYQYDQQHYSINRNFGNDENSNFIRPSMITERDKFYDQSIHSYIDTGRTQEPLNPITSAENSDTALRHYTLKRTDSYNGMGVVISSDVETRLNHRIRDVEPTSPGSRVGLRKNDRIVNVNGVNVENVEFGDVLMLIKQGLNNNHLQFSVINEAVLI